MGRTGTKKIYKWFYKFFPKSHLLFILSFVLGPRCETCSDGYFGNPEKGIACRPCDCNNNIDLNAVRNCNHETGECLKCVNNTAGFHCEECLSGI